MKKPKIVTRVFETYIALIENSLGSKLFRTLIADVDGVRSNILRDGQLSCAIFVSSILMLIGLIDRVHATVASTVAKLEQSGWKRVRVPKKGDVLVWEEKKFGDEQHRHIGFYLGDELAVSQSSKRKVPVKHHWTNNGKRRIKLILHYPKSMQSLLKK